MKRLKKDGKEVLILVLMEYGLGDENIDLTEILKVLILVLMEYGLGVSRAPRDVVVLSLNPCFNGIWSRG